MKRICLFIVVLITATIAFAQETKSKTLVVYFSATGTTERVAKVIGNLTNGDLYSLEPVQKYSSSDLDWTNNNSRTNKERNISNFVTPLKNAIIPNINNYDTIYIGAPIWWGKASWVINEFLIKNNFSNKIIIPFCTSASSPYADAGSKMQKIASGGKWLTGVRFGSRSTESEIKNFVKQVQNAIE